MDDTVWRQSSLPVSRGALGTRRVDQLALPASLASVHSAFDLMKQIYPQVDVNCIVSPAISHWQVKSISQPPILTLRSTQKAWDIPIVDQHYQTLLDASSQAERARLVAVSAKDSGAWLNALPISVLGNLLDDNSFRISVGLLLGARLRDPHVCRCKKLVDELGRHGLSCQLSAGRHSRHPALNDSIHRALISCKVPNVLEPNGILRDDQKRPDGLTLIPWQQGKALVLDVTCVDTVKKTYLRGSAGQLGYAAHKAEELKRHKYRDPDGRYLFCPVAFETFGPFGNEASSLIQ
ncbi:hypothetical protein RvY_18857 [Ramazzottius varieornatus]|uniref:Uncharacterized protein n=1 Tax=Ramazzottius varieornatus TaxID=947166 RepID=A0A1D1WA43_RAMVA|nr:hypothetical protein RvY_18857 [Ramazzottius varieornatus]